MTAVWWPYSFDRRLFIVVLSRGAFFANLPLGGTMFAVTDDFGNLVAVQW